MRKTILLTMLCLLAVTATAQRGKTVTATGTGTDKDLTVATKLALFDAKQNALKEAGVAEDVRSHVVLYMGTDNTAGREYATGELDMVMLDGQVRVKRAELDTALRNGMAQVTARVRAEVLTEDGADEEFTLRVSGMKPVYREEERVDFSIQPSKDCYLRIFWFSPPKSARSEGGQLYPLQGKYGDRLFHADSTYHYPRLPQDCVTGNPQKLLLDNEGTADVEYNVIFVVATKKKIAYDRPAYTYEEFVRWLWTLPRDGYVWQYGMVGVVK